MGVRLKSNTSSLKTRGPASVIISYGIWVRMGDDAAAKGRFREKNTWLNALDCKSLNRAEFHFIFSVKLFVSHKRCAWKAFTDTRTPSHDSTSLPMVYKPKIYPTRCIAISPIRYRRSNKRGYQEILLGFSKLVVSRLLVTDRDFRRQEPQPRFSHGERIKPMMRMCFAVLRRPRWVRSYMLPMGSRS